MADDTFDIYEEYGKERIRGDELFGIAADLLKALEDVQQDVCSLLCPSVWETGRQQRHSERCKAISAAITKAKADA